MTRRELTVVHLFPDLLNVYGDLGNVRTIERRAGARGIEVSVRAVRGGDRAIPRADLILIGGGQDMEQRAVARALLRLGRQVREQIRDGAALLAVCAGYQSLGWSYRTAAGEMIEGPGLLDVHTQAGPDRLVGPVVGSLAMNATAADQPAPSVVGFENHAGRTYPNGLARPLANLEIGRGNNGEDGTEGLVALPGEGELGGLRIGTYLHGPLLPRNPHIADLLIAAALARGGAAVELPVLEDAAEWRAHETFAARTRHNSSRERSIPGWVHQLVDGPRSLIGF